MPPEPTPAAATELLATALSTMAEQMLPIAEAVQGYKAARIAEGFTDSQAGDMAVHYHELLCIAMARTA